MKNIPIPVKPHVLKYLEHHVGANYVLAESDHFGLFLFQLMRRPMTDKRKDELVAKYKAVFTVDFGPYSPYQYGLKNLTGKTVYLFNSFVHKIILAEMHGYVDLTTDFGSAVKHAIQCFMQKYSFTEDDIAYDTLLKSYQRYERGERKKKAGKKGPDLTPRKVLRDLERKLLRVPLGVPTVALQKQAPQSV